MNKIVKIAVTNDLQTDQRVHKVCLTLSKNGYEPHLIGIYRPKSKPLKREYNIERVPLFFQKTALFYAEYNLRLFFKLLFSKFDIVLSNDTDTLPACFLTAKIRCKPIVFDAHELFTELPELVNRPVIRKIWNIIENLILPRIKFAYTVCKPIADIYGKKNNLHMEVVRNAPIIQKSQITPQGRLYFEGKKILLYQGAINVGRGLEWVIDAMPLLDDTVFCIAGVGDIFDEIKERIHLRGVEDRVVLLGEISFEELHAYTISADLGISLLENRGLNYYYSLPNRIFDFAQAEVPVLATDFPEIRNVVEKYGIGSLISHYEPAFLAETIKNMLSEWEAKTYKKIIFERAKQELCWENEETTLINLFDSIK